MRVAKAFACFLVLAPLAISSAGCSPEEESGGQLGISDTCDNPPADVTLDSLDVGLVENGRFTPFAEDEVVTLTYGLQGSAMIGLHLRASGADVPDCLGQVTLIYKDGSIAGDLFSPLKTYAQSDGTFRTDTAWLVLFPSVLAGDQLSIETEAGGQTYERRIFADERGDGQVR